jgi:SAM-dependent methyltransferase
MNNSVKNYNEHAQDWATELRAGRKLPHEYVEKPAMYSQLPDLKGKEVLCVGCGTGEECDFLMKKGAKRVVGIDLADKMIEIAKTSFPEVHFEVMDIEKMKFEKKSFDFIYSSLTFHYSDKWPKIFSDLASFLKDGGVVLFSVLHPMYWGTEFKKDAETKTTTRLIGIRSVNEVREMVGDYLTSSWRKAEIYGGVGIEYFNQPISAMFDIIKKAGFSVENILEPKSLEKLKDIHPEYHKSNEKFPQFIIFKLKLK